MLQTCWFLLWIWQVYYELHIQSHDTPQIGEVVAKGEGCWFWYRWMDGCLSFTQKDPLSILRTNVSFLTSKSPGKHQTSQVSGRKFRQPTNFQDGLLKNFVSLVIPGFMVLEMTWNPGAWMVTDLSGGLPGDCFREVVLKGLGRHWIG